MAANVPTAAIGVATTEPTRARNARGATNLTMLTVEYLEEFCYPEMCRC